MLDPVSSRKPSRHVAWTWVLGACLLTGLGTGPAQAQQTQPAGPSRPALAQAIRLARDYMARACDPQGRFVYWIHLDPSRKMRPAYNEVRHAGAVYALAMALRWEPHEPTRRALLRAAEYFRRTYVRAPAGRSDVLGVWGDPLDEAGLKGEYARLGGAGLGLAALVNVESVIPGATPLEDLRALGRFLVLMQKPSGAMYSRYMPPTGPDDQWQSLYYPGEAALGLIMLYELDPQPQWLRSAAAALGYLARIRIGRDTVPPDHWALLATPRVLAHLDKLPDPPTSRLALIRHANQIVQSILLDAPRDTQAALHGTLSPEGMTTRTATRLEGLLAVMDIMAPAHESWHRRMTQAAPAGIAFLMRSQVQSGPHSGAIPRTLYSGWPDLSKAADPRDAEVRIDYVQHALSAMIQYWNLTTPSATAPR